MNKNYIKEEFLSDFEIIMSHRYDNGADLWTTPDKRLIKGSPFSMLECIIYLNEIGVRPEDDIIKKCTEVLFNAWREDGSFKLSPTGTVYPCHTANAASVLCQLGYVNDERIQKTLKCLLDTRYKDGGWRCNKFSFGKGEETESSNPLPTLTALNAFRFSRYLNEPSLDDAVEFLLEHWRIRKPIGPCHYGIGTLFMQVEYPFRNYNIFMYVYILSFYEKAKKDPRFLEALDMLESKMTDGKIVVERVVPKLAKLAFCRKNESSEPATRHYQEILNNLGRVK